MLSQLLGAFLGLLKTCVKEKRAGKSVSVPAEFRLEHVPSKKESECCNHPQCCDFFPSGGACFFRPAKKSRSHIIFDVSKEAFVFQTHSSFMKYLINILQCIKD